MPRSISATALLAVVLFISAFAQQTQGASACLVPPSGLVAWWPGDTNENDIVGGNNPSAVSLVSLVPGEVLDGFTFGTNGYILIPSSPTLANQTFTWAAWVRPDGPGPLNDRNGSSIINQITDGSSAGSNFVQLSWSSASHQFVFVFGNTHTEFILSTDTFPPGTFYFVAGTYDGSVFRLFVNGVPEGTFTETKTVPYSSAGWQIGGNSPAQNPNPFTRTWNGVIDEVQIFNRALSASELLSIFNTGTSGECKAPAIGGIVSASAFGEFAFASPGSWVEIYGSNLADETRGWTGDDFTGINAPTSLGGTSVSIGGKAAFIDYISPGQVNALLPSDAPTGVQQITLTTAGVAAPAFNITINAVSPGLLAPPNFSVSGVQYVVAQFGDGTYVLPTGAVSGVTSRPAKPGDIIVIYGVGFGPVTPDIPAGQLVGEANSLATDFHIFIGGIGCGVQYDGLAPSYTGLYQFNIVVPTIASGNQPLTFTVDGVNGTQTLYVAVQN